MDISSVVLSGSRRKRVVFGGVLAVATGLMGVPILLLSVWPWIDHSPWAVNTMLAGFGLCCTSLSYAFGRIAIAGWTEGSRRPVADPGSRPYVVAGIGLLVALLAVLVAAAS